MHELTLISVHPLFDLISVNSYELAFEVISDVDRRGMRDEDGLR